MKRGVRTIITGVVLLVFGTGVVPFLILFPTFGKPAREYQFLVPGEIRVEVEKPGRYFLWNNFQTEFNGRHYNAPEEVPSAMTVEILDARGERMDFQRMAGITTTVMTDARRSVGYVDVEEPGGLLVRVGGLPREWIFAFDRNTVVNSVFMVLMTILLAGFLALVSFGLIVWGIVKAVSGPGHTGQDVNDNLVRRRG